MLVLATATAVLAGLAHALPASIADASDAVQQLVLGRDAAVAAVVGAPHTMTRWDWVDCGEPTDVIQIKDVRISPDPPKPGKNLTVYASGTVNELIDQGAYADVTVKLGLIKLLTKRFDVCDELDNANSTLQCPIKPDEYSIEQTVALPAEIPRAKFQVSARVFNQDELPAACIDLWINFLLPDPVQD
ncbi:Phosphatidylglycerol/phosphatidylinositol transfer protein [Microbotryomycetes sp. NB124-2]